MSLRRYMLRMAITTAIIAPVIGLITHNHNWLWSIPLGFIFGAIAGLVFHWPSKQLVLWLERREDKRWHDRRALRDELTKAAEEELNR